MKVRAIRGVCIGPERHLAPGQAADVDDVLARFLLGIGAVEPHVDVPHDPEPPTHPKPARKAGDKE